MKKFLILFALVFLIFLPSARAYSQEYNSNEFDTIRLNQNVKQTIYRINLICYLTGNSMLQKTNTISYINGSVFVNYRKVKVPKKLTKDLVNFELRKIEQ